MQSDSMKKAILRQLSHHNGHIRNDYIVCNRDFGVVHYHLIDFVLDITDDFRKGPAIHLFEVPLLLLVRTSFRGSYLLGLDFNGTTIKMIHLLYLASSSSFSTTPRCAIRSGANFHCRSRAVTGRKRTVMGQSRSEVIVPC